MPTDRGRNAPKAPVAVDRQEASWRCVSHRRARVGALWHADENQRRQRGRPARDANSPRQPMACTTSSAGAVAVTAPSAPSITSQPLASASRWGGNQSTMALNPAIRANATPSPSKARPMTKPTRPSANANTRRRRCQHQESALDGPRPMAVEQGTGSSCTAAKTRK
jgi:hypothetical protein